MTTFTRSEQRVGFSREVSGCLVSKLALDDELLK
jgi:hypothetical protein